MIDTSNTPIRVCAAQVRIGQQLVRTAVALWKGEKFLKEVYSNSGTRGDSEKAASLAQSTAMCICIAYDEAGVASEFDDQTFHPCDCTKPSVVRPGGPLHERPVEIVVVNTAHEGIYNMQVDASKITLMDDGWHYRHLGVDCVSEKKDGKYFYGAWG